MKESVQPKTFLPLQWLEVSAGTFRKNNLIIWFLFMIFSSIKDFFRGYCQFLGRQCKRSDHHCSYLSLLCSHNHWGIYLRLWIRVNFDYSAYNFKLLANAIVTPMGISIWLTIRHFLLTLFYMLFFNDFLKKVFLVRILSLVVVVVVVVVVALK